jgi:beta-N-acetylhexosaminidase
LIIKTWIFLLPLIFLLVWCSPNQKPYKVKTGLDRIYEYQSIFQGKRIGIITNHTAYNSNHQHISDVFFNMKDVTVTALFGPEHGIRGAAEAGAKIESQFDLLNKIPIYSLYGEVRKPTPEMLENIDLLVFDIQDIGARFYTYIYTMSLAMEAAAEQGKQFVVLDRPNPINGIAVEGNILEPEFATFVGLYPIPVRYGMTVAELAKMFNEEGWLENGVKAKLTVIPMKNWHRTLFYDKTGLTFIKPSPNMPNLKTAIVYPGACLIEGTNISEGRGTTSPFQLLGAPWINGNDLANTLNALQLSGVSFYDTTFTPDSIPGAAPKPKFKDQSCSGIKIKVTDRIRFKPYSTGINIINTIHQMYSDSLKWRVSHFDRLCGNASIREAIINKKDIQKLPLSWKDNLNEFLKIRKKYLIYD